ncbi:HNH endonuclease [Caldisalinibacter kiritimatiensis]|uniref:HNH endonuclease:HNH nuclease n=1 Tax=Caldisalinibacter kiritimatiensis TaxID=1304284 RepID=R1CE12_9FIRM|nr:HNH endonuclease signature motif containing protein [Caldisalinibacter kiritimatiensis]EOD00505.1 HNH endonuclease:HNH nuclease [Caldisalinibacter kiritimatiensis]
MSKQLNLMAYKNALLGNQNSYKFALGLAIINTIKSDRKISYTKIAKEIARYYFKHHFIYKINETNNLNQKPIVITILEEYMKIKYGKKIIPTKLTNNDLDNLSIYLIDPSKMKCKVNDLEIKKKLNKQGFFYYTLPCWQHASKENGKKYYSYKQKDENDYFSYDIDEQEIVITDSFYKLITKEKELLKYITVTEWVKFAEKFNITPRLYQKISLDKPKRNNQKFRELFDNIKILEGNICYICGEKIIRKREKTLDHVIPFSYVYSCELWNLATAHKTCNSSKGNKIGSPNMIKKLIRRNENLWELDDDIPAKYKKKYYKYFKNTFNCKQDIAIRIQKLVQDCKEAGFQQMKSKRGQIL